MQAATTRRAGRGCWFALWMLALLAGGAHDTRADEAVWSALQRGGHVVLIRHAITVPGVGDPPGFRLHDCTTQRNLTDEGRAHARRVGAAFRARKIAVGRLLSSPWCRCIETARLAFGPPDTSVPLSNLFGRPENREPQVTELRRIVGAWRARGNLVLVSHGSTISALTGVPPATAEMVVVKPEGGETFSVVGRISVP
jgi:broad specificity phosphatase PhoE